MKGQFVEKSVTTIVALILIVIIMACGLFLLPRSAMSDVAYTAVNDNISGLPDVNDQQFTVYFVNTPGWNKVYVYYWGGENGESVYPGKEMTNSGEYTNSNNEKYNVYSYKIPNDVSGIFFTDGSFINSTVDITSGISDGMMWYPEGTINNKYSVVSLYPVNTNAKKGTVTADKDHAKEDDTVTLTVTPDAGYALRSLTVMQGNNAVTVNENEDGTYSFTMPAGAVTVSAEFAVPVTYIGADGKEQTTADYTVLDGTEPVNQFNMVIIDGGTYVVDRDLTYDTGLSCFDNVKLILCDGCTLTVKNSGNFPGIQSPDHSLEIFAQEKGTGKLNINISDQANGIEAADLSVFGGKINISSSSEDNNCVVAKNILFAGGNIKLEGGENCIKIDDIENPGSFTLGYTRATDSISIGGEIKCSDNITIKIAEGKIMTDGENEYDNNLYNGDDIERKTLTPANAFAIYTNIGHAVVDVPAKAFACDTVNMTVTADMGYAVKTVTLTTDEYELDATDNHDGTYYFDMPFCDVTISVETEGPMNIIDTASVTLGGELGLNFYIKVSAETAAAGAKVVMNGREGERTVVLSGQDPQNSSYKITYPIKAINMASTVELQIRDSEGKVLDIVDHDLESIGNNTFKYGVYDYVTKAKGSSTLTNKQKAMVNAMYTYGAYSELWKHGTELPEGVEALPVISTDGFSAYQPVISGSSDGITLKSLSLVLDSNTALRLYFTCEDNISGHTVSYNDGGSTDTPLVIQKSDSDNDNEWFVEISGIAARNLKTAYTIKIDNSLTVDASAMSYVYLSLRNNTAEQKVRDVIRALVAYSNAADNYFSN